MQDLSTQFYTDLGAIVPRFLRESCKILKNFRPNKIFIQLRGKIFVKILVFADFGLRNLKLMKFYYNTVKLLCHFLRGYKIANIFKIFLKRFVKFDGKIN